MKEKQEHLDNFQRNRGVVLMVVLVLLMALSIMGYILSMRVMAHRRRTQYMVDYQVCRYACDSGIKYALAIMNDLNDVDLIPRPNEPDFSDIFALDEVEYRDMLANWAETMTVEQAKKYRKQQKQTRNKNSDVNDMNDVDSLDDYDEELDYESLLSFAADANLGYDPNDPNLLQVPGPYGPPWPLVNKQAVFEIGDATVTVEVHDENAKYPISWLLLDDEDIERQIQVGFENFCEWMDVNSTVKDDLYDDLDQLNEIKQFKLKFEGIKVSKKQKVKSSSRRSSRSRRRSRRTRTRTVTVTMPATLHLTNFARLYHSAIIDTEPLAKPIIETDERVESALKYISLWPTTQVNINTAPRNVLESALAFGGISDAVPLADEIIRYRQTEPFSDSNDIRQKIYRYSDAVNKCRKYIVTDSDFFTIRVTASSGMARASAIVAVRKNGKKMERIAVLTD